MARQTTFSLRSRQRYTHETFRAFAQNQQLAVNCYLQDSICRQNIYNELMLSNACLNFKRMFEICKNTKN